MTIRGYQSFDLHPCRSLYAEMTQRHRDIYDDPSIGGDDPGLGFDAHLGQVGPERIWVDEMEGELTGLVSLILDGEQAEVEPIVVGRAYRGQGIGKRLLDHVTQEAEKLGVLCLYVKPVARNIDAIGFFHDAGFSTLGHVQLFKWLGPSAPGQWKKGPDLFGRSFDY
jgi:GNAT superfamily N-acetyltransferase